MSDRICKHHWRDGAYKIVDSYVASRICDNCGAAQWKRRHEKIAMERYEEDVKNGKRDK